MYWTLSVYVSTGFQKIVNDKMILAGNDDGCFVWKAKIYAKCANMKQVMPDGCLRFPRRIFLIAACPVQWLNPGWAFIMSVWCALAGAMQQMPPGCPC